MTGQRSLYRRIAETIFGTKAGAWIILTLASRIDPHLLGLTSGRVSTVKLFGYPTLLLTTTGAKSGLPRAVTLTYFHDGDRIIVVASRGGMVQHPGWFHNLKAHPEAEVLLPGYSGLYTAHEASGEERERLWALACEHWAGFIAYQKRAGDRIIPVMVLTPVGSHGEIVSHPKP